MHAILIILTAAIVTLLIRALPFIVLTMPFVVTFEDAT